MHPMVAGEDGKVEGGRKGNRYFTLIFHGHVCGWCKVGVIVFTTRELLLSFGRG
jgi:hypothetical protein